MKAKRFTTALLSTILLSYASAMAQTIDVEVKVKGIEEAKGTVLIALGDMDKPDEMFTGLTEVKEKGEVTIVLHNVPVGLKTELNVFQDMNGNMELDTNALGMPTELCAKKNVTVKADKPVLEIKLLDIQGMLGM